MTRELRIGERCIRALELAGLKDAKIGAIPADELMLFSRVLLSQPRDDGYTIRFHEPDSVVSHVATAMTPSAARAIADCVSNHLGVTVEVSFGGEAVAVHTPSAKAAPEESGA